MSAALLASGWGLVALLGAVAALHLIARDHDSYVFGLDAYTFWIYLPAYAVLLGAAIGRRPWLAGSALLLVACHVAWLIPSVSGAARIPAAARRAPHFVLVSANVRYDNPTPEKLLRELWALDADVVDLQEITPEWVVRLRDDGFFDRYRYRVLAPVAGPGGTAILSRFPVRGSTTVDAVGDRLAFATIDIDGRAVGLLAVHPRAPVTFALWKEQSRTITAFVEHAARPLVLAGDFNATQYNSWLARLKDLGLRSAHELLGKGLATTWPNGTRNVPPIRLDHVLVSRSVVPLAIREGRGAGSDHRPVIASLALL